MCEANNSRRELGDRTSREVRGVVGGEGGIGVWTCRRGLGWSVGVGVKCEEVCVSATGWVQGVRRVAGSVVGARRVEGVRRG